LAPTGSSNAPPTHITPSPIGAHRFFQRLQVEDPDVLVGHNILGFDLEVLLSRALALKISVWSKVGDYVCRCACVHVRMYVCMCVYVCVYACIYQ
jgi:hypothetical protein